VDARVGPARVPSIEIGLRFLDRLEAHPVERRLLRVADAGFDFAFAIGVADTAWERDDAVMREHIAIERIEGGIVDVGREHALFEIVEDHDARGAAESTKRALVELGPRLCARLPREQANRFP